ncbi:unnamed protein product [Ectocarpus sp. 6 AP-2014]
MGASVPMDVLVTKPEHSLVFQSRDASFHPGCADKRNIRVNGDGFGIAWYTPRRIEEGGCVVKFPTPAWSNTNLLNIAKFVESGLVFAHVRAASDGAVLVGNVNHENTHPFKYKRYTFMHNGGIPGFARMKRQLLAQLGDEAYLAVEGSTDSELCFAFFLDELPNTDDQLSAQEISQVLRRTIARIVSAVASLSASPCPPAPPTATTTAPSISGNDGGPTTSPPDAASARGGSSASAAAPAMSLNFCVTDGRHIVCSRYRSHARQHPPSLFVLAGAGLACDEAGCLRLTAPVSLHRKAQHQLSAHVRSRSMKMTKIMTLLLLLLGVLILGSAHGSDNDNNNDNIVNNDDDDDKTFSHDQQEPVVVIEPSVLPGSNYGDSSSLPFQPLSSVDEDATTTTAASTHDSFEHVGCLKLTEEEMVSLGRIETKAEAHIIPGMFGRDDMTPQQCAAICEGGGQDGFAVTRGNLCTCFAEADAGIFDGSKGGVCDAPCTGDSSQPCGGIGSFDVYRLSLTGGRHATITVENTGLPVNDETTTTADFTAGDAKTNNNIRQGTVKVKTFVSWWRPRQLSLVDASTLKLCKKTHGRGVKSCQDMPLDSSTEVVRVEGKHGRPRKGGRFVFRVSTGTPRGLTNKRWELDAGSSADLDTWMSVIEGVTTPDFGKEADFFGDTPRAGDLGDSFKFSMELGPFTFAPTPAFRGDSISVDDYPLIPGQFLSTAPVVKSANLEVTEVGDLILRQGDIPAYPTDDTPLWAHRVTGSVGDTANGGLGCALEAWWERATNGGEDMGIPVHLSVKNGRWRVGRGWMCTLGRSPRVAGGWRVHLPWDSHGKAVKAASLQVRDGSAVMATEDGHILWSSSPSP